MDADLAFDKNRNFSTAFPFFPRALISIGLV
jgi:hypothetical protein